MKAFLGVLGPWIARMESTKFQVTIAGVLWVLFSEKLKEWGITEDQVNQVVYLLLGWLGAQGIADLGKEAKKVEH